MPQKFIFEGDENLVRALKREREGQESHLKERLKDAKEASERKKILDELHEVEKAYQDELKKIKRDSLW
jgi:hypothetical protein